MNGRIVGDKLLIDPRDQKCFMVESRETLQLSMPLDPLILRSKKVVLNVAEKFNFHN